MEKRNRYKNRVGIALVVRIVLAGGLLLGAGAGFVAARNGHVLQGNDIVTIEREIAALDRETEMWEVRIAGVRDRQELSRRLRWVQSDLAEIDPSKVIEIGKEPAVGRPMASAY